jgi:hypothetical protein
VGFLFQVVDTAMLPRLARFAATSFGGALLRVVPVDHRCVSSGARSIVRRGRIYAASLLAATLICKVHAHETPSADDKAVRPAQPASCLPSGDGYLRARLAGAIKSELVWGNDGTECTGAVRPSDGGIRMRFSRPESEPAGAAAAQPGRLVLVFGIAGLREGQSARALPVNLTVIREGHGQFFSTQGDDKCTLDEVTQQPIVGIPHRSRSYKVVARGFCTEPARAVRGNGAVLLSRFDFAGRIDFDSEDTQDTDAPVAEHQ